MDAVSIQCPKCEAVSDLYLGSEAFMIVLNCPNCGIPLIYYYGKNFEVNEIQIKQIQNNGYLKNAGDLLKSISQCGVKMNAPKSVKPYSPVSKIKSRRQKIGRRYSNHLLGQSVRAEYFTKDDLLNLKIELETCFCVEDFLSRI
jgi:hypothetical protein